MKPKTTEYGLDYLPLLYHLFFAMLLLCGCDSHVADEETEAQTVRKYAQVSRVLVIGSRTLCSV